MGRILAASIDDDLDPIDELTELFLGGTVALPPPSVAPSHARHDLSPDDLPLPPLRGVPARSSPPEKPAVPKIATMPTPARAATLASTGVFSRLEVVVVGHLPVAASAWVHQYARHRQRQLAATLALLRVRGNAASLDLLGDHAPLAPATTLQEALGVASSRTSMIVVSVEETDEIEASQSPGVARVAVLTGSHDTAVVACYRALKGLVQHEAIREGRTELAVAILGGPEERSKAAAARLRKTTSAYLAHEVACEVAHDKITPSEPRTLFAGELEGSTMSLVRSLVPIRPADPSASTPLIGEKPAELAPHTAPLASRLPGLRPVEVRCPFAPLVEIAVGAEGEMHVVANASAAADIPAAVADLTAAAAWVRTNADVLKASIPELARRVAAVEPREHLVTAEPRAVRALIDSRLMLHLNTAGAIVDLN
jgi:hypothetical protein